MKKFNRFIIYAALPLFLLGYGCNNKEENQLLKARDLILKHELAEAKKIFDTHWIDQFDSLISNTLPGPLEDGKWGFSRVKGDKMYLFISKWQPGHIFQFPNTELPISDSRCLNNDLKVKVKWATGVEIFMKKEDRDPSATVIELTLEGDAEKLHNVKVSDWEDPALNAKKENMEDWLDQRFGMFIHFGPCTIDEIEISWSRKASKMGRIRYEGAGVNGEYFVDPHYDSLYHRFNPYRFNADSLVQLAKSTGMKYIVLVAKHHDSFCLFDSKYTDYDIMSTPYGKDFCKELADACHKSDMKLGWYYSPRDWYHKDFGGPNHDKYMEFYMNQLEELLTHYGKIDILWFDCLDSPQYIWKDIPEKSFKKIREWQPDIVINNRGGLRGDFDTPENSIGDFEVEYPWETCISLTTGWSWRGDLDPKSKEWVVKTLVKTIGNGGNFLLNIGPRPDGSIAPKQVKALNEVGEWVNKYQESIFNTRGGPFIPTKDIYFTHKNDVIYAHFIGETHILKLPDFGYVIESCELLNEGSATCIHENNNWVIEVLPEDKEEIDLVVKLKLNKDLKELIL